MHRRKYAVISAVVFALLALTGCQGAITVESADTANQTSPTVPVVDTNDAIAVLNSLTVKGRAPKTGYDRERFGPAWSDVDRNGCDTRNDILKRDMTEVTYKTGTNDCVVLTGVLADPYTGKTINFKRGKNTSSAVQIDHVIPLSLAWQTGAQQLDAENRKAFSNDPLNLLAVDGPSNGQKSDGDAATWLPANKDIRCEYVARQIAVRAKYGLWVTKPEKNAMTDILSGCPGQALPNDASSLVAAPAPALESAPTPPVEQPDPTPMPANDPQFGSCKDVKTAGYGPYTKGVNPEYSWYRDADGDGTVCE